MASGQASAMRHTVLLWWGPLGLLALVAVALT